MGSIALPAYRQQGRQLIAYSLFMLSIGIVGLPNVGKSTMFKALTKKQIDIQNYPFTTIDPAVGVVAVPDDRLDALTKLSGSAKIIPTAIEFTDIAGLVKGASEGEGLGNKFLANIRETDAIVQVVRVFEDDEITHVHKKVDPISDIQTINAELILADLDTIAKRLAKARPSDPNTKDQISILEKLRDKLNTGKLANTLSFSEKELPIVRELHLLTNKKFIYVLNISEAQLKEGYAPPQNLLDAFDDNPYVAICNTFELLLSEASEDEKNMYLEDVNLKQSGLDLLIKTGYKTLNLLTFLTTGTDETRAWTSHVGDLIPVAVGAIHTDFTKQFIRADVINWQELINVGGWSQARDKGKLRTEGKDYIITEGDVIEVKI